MIVDGLGILSFAIFFKEAERKTSRDFEKNKIFCGCW